METKILEKVGKQKWAFPGFPLLIQIMTDFVDAAEEALEAKYDIGHKIGAGTYSEVFFCTAKDDRDNGQYVVKMIDIGKVTEATFEREITLLEAVPRHDYIAKYVESFKTSRRNREGVEFLIPKFIIIEYVHGCELYASIKERYFPEGEAKPIIRQLCQAVRHLHTQSPPIMHRDIKPENVMHLAAPDPDTGALVKLIDFGVGKILTGSQRGKGSVGVGSGVYMAPEMRPGGGYDPHYTTAVDLYSLGATLYAMLCFCPPPVIETSHPSFTASDWPRHVPFSSGVKTVITGLMALQPSARMSLDQVLACDWLQ